MGGNLFLVVLFLCLFNPSLPLDNGMALTPPMGWLSWAKFYCETDCLLHPHTCINEDLYLAMADRLVNDGYLAAGWNFVNVDDCWSSKKRDAQGRLQSDPYRFPHGIKWLADQMHSKGLKLGIYGDVGNATCAGYPGSKDYLELDAQTIAEWGVDSWKFDGCNADLAWVNHAYPAMSHFLNQTKHHLVYSCEWTLNQRLRSAQPDYNASQEFCNVDRNFDDIDKSWASIAKTIDFYDHHQDEIAPFVGPGHFSDPDMIVVGNDEVTVEQSKAQMALWSIWSAPLLMSNDLRTIRPEYKAILQNRKVIAINQDPFGRMGRLVANVTFVGVYTKEVSPQDKTSGEFSYAVVFLNRDLNYKAMVSTVLKSLGLKNSGGYVLEDLFEGISNGHVKPDDTIVVTVPPSGVVMLKATLAQKTPFTQDI